MNNIVVLTRDLMDGSRFCNSSSEVKVVSSLSAPELANSTLIIVDLAFVADLSVLLSLGPPVVAYGAHIDVQALETAIAKGCAAAVPRSRIFRWVAELRDEGMAKLIARARSS